MATSLFWGLLVVVAVLIAYTLCNSKKITISGSSTGSGTSTTRIPRNARVAFTRRHATLTVEHNEPLLGSLFSRELEALPDGITRDEFERAVSDYQHQHLKEVEIKIPRSLNFNYDKYAAEQEAMRRNVSATASKFIQREEIGGISEQLIKGASASQTLAPRSSVKKAVAKRR